MGLGSKTFDGLAALALATEVGALVTELEAVEPAWLRLLKLETALELVRFSTNSLLHQGY